eukprot:Skav209775  [mRNA]  locus=scaffold9:468496:481990:+ [translate_table: standard]
MPTPGGATFPQPSNLFQNTNQQRLEFLAQVKLFQRLPEDQHNLLASRVGVVAYPSDAQVIIKQGDHGHEFFVIKEGSAEVLILKKKQAATLKAGDYFGENALLRDESGCPDQANAGRDHQGAVQALKITREQFIELGLRPWSCGTTGVVPPILACWQEPTPKTESQRASVQEWGCVVDLDIPRVKAICDIAWREDGQASEISCQEVPKGTKLIEEGDLNADYFYIVQSGDMACSHLHSSSASLPPSFGLLRIGPGGSFGELALLYFAPRAATIEERDSCVQRLGNFKRIMAKSSDEREADYLKHLEKAVDILSPLKKEEKAALANHQLPCAKEVSFVKGDIIFKQGDEGDSFYLLLDGTVEVVKDTASRLQGSPDKAEELCYVCFCLFFGERALLKNEPRAATIKIQHQSCKARTLMVDKQSFDMLLGPLEELKKRGKAGPGSKLQDGDGGRISAAIDKSRFGQIKRKDRGKTGKTSGGPRMVPLQIAGLAEH